MTNKCEDRLCKSDKILKLPLANGSNNVWKSHGIYNISLHHKINKLKFLYCENDFFTLTFFGNGLFQKKSKQWQLRISI